MEKLIFKSAVSEEEIDEVLEKIEGYSSVKLPLEYAKNGKIVGAFLQDKLVACYMLITKPSFRSKLFVPDAVKSSHEFFKKDEYEMMEVNGLWIGPSLKKPSMQVRVWFEMVKDIFLAKKKYVLLMQNSNNRCMKKYLSMANPTVLYKGQPQLMPGERTHKTIEVSFTTRWSIVINCYKYLAEFRNRQRRVSKSRKEKHNVLDHAQTSPSIRAVQTN